MLKPVILKETMTNNLKMQQIFQGNDAYQYSAWERISLKNSGHYCFVRKIDGVLYGKIGSYKVDGRTIDEVESEFNRAYMFILKEHPHLDQGSMVLMVGGDIFECERVKIG